MTTVDSTPGSTATGRGSGSGGGGKAPSGGGDPPRGHYYAKGGDTTSPLWLYDVRSAKSYVLEWLTARAQQPMTVRLIQELAHFLWQLQAQGINLGPHLRLTAVHREDDEAYLSPTTIAFRNDPPPTVHQFFGMGTSRGYYDTNVEAVIQQAAAGNRVFFGVNRCNRCTSTRAQQTFATCAQSYYQGRVLNWGACNECALNGNTDRCTFSDRRADTTSDASPSLSEIVATTNTARPNHPQFPSPQTRARRASSAAARADLGSSPVPMRTRPGTASSRDPGVGASGSSPPPASSSPPFEGFSD